MDIAPTINSLNYFLFYLLNHLHWYRFRLNLQVISTLLVILFY